MLLTFLWAVGSSLFFLLATWVLGWWVLKRCLKYAPWHIQISLGMGLGVIISILLLDILVAILGWQGHVVVGVILMTSLVVGFKEQLSIRYLSSTAMSWAVRHWTLTAVLLITTLTVWLSIAGSGWPTQGGFGYQPTIMHDSLWHLALIKALAVSNPPVHPSSSDLFLSNYHYLYDMWLASWQYLTGTNPQDLYFRVSTLFILGFVSLSSLSLIRLLVIKRPLVFANLWLVTLWWAGSFSYLIPLLLREVKWGESSFWVSQTFVMLVNPQFLLSLGLLSCLIILGILPLKKNIDKLNWMWWTILVSMLLYVLAGVKFFGVVFGLMWVGVMLIYYLWKRIVTFRQFGLICLWLVGIGLVILWRFVDLSNSSLIWAPLWFVNTMVAVEDRLPIRELVLREQYYKELGSWHYLFLLKAAETVIFYVGNLGVRVLGLLIGVIIWLNQKSARKSISHPLVWVLILALAVVSSIIPMLFIQHGVVWNSIQFWYYTLFFADILLVGVLGYWWVNAKRPRSTKSAIITLLFFSSLMFMIHMSTQFRWSEKIPNQAIEITKLLSSNDRLLVCPQIDQPSLYFKSSFFSGFSESRIHFIDPDQAEILGLEGEESAKVLKELFDQHKGLDLLSRLPPKTTLVLCNYEYFGSTEEISDKVVYQDEKLMMVSAQ